MRHLPTEGTPAGRIDRHQLAARLDTANGQGIRSDATVSSTLHAAVAGSTSLVVSPLLRAQQTAAVVLALLADEAAAPTVVTMSGVREAPLPKLKFRPRLPLDAWDVLSRAAWMLGYSGGVETRAEAVVRARRAAVEIERLAVHGPVTVIAHGYFNLMLAAQFRARGWRGPRFPNHRNGAVTRYTLDPRHPPTPDRYIRGTCDLAAAPPKPG